MNDFADRVRCGGEGGALLGAGRLLSETESAPSEEMARAQLAHAATYHGRLINFVRKRFRLGEDALDIVQDAYARLIQATERAPIRDAPAFLHVVAANLARDRLRSQALRNAAKADAASTGDVECRSPSPERAVISRQQLAIIEQALGELSLKCRAALVLHRFENLTHAEIAAQLGISVSMVEKHIRRGLRHCRRRLEEANGETLT